MSDEGPFFGADHEALDISLLGRGILEMFAVIGDRPADDVLAVIGGQHRYAIQQRQ